MGQPHQPAGDAGYCDRCGLQLGSDEGAHDVCRAARKLEPPRYCPRCGRRMVVQVTPESWSSRCTVHGLLTDAG